MTDPPPIVPLLGQRLKPSKRPHTSQSPTRYRPSDDLLKHLTPAQAVSTLRSPTGPIQTALDNATPSEQAFAMQTAMAARSIQKWLDELMEWTWPDSGGPDGFLRSKLMNGESVPRESGEFIGSLTASALSRYEKRMAEILQGMEELNVEDIKAQVLHNHIMPLSRPGTPLSDCSRISYTRMDDLTAVVTAIVVQALPGLSRLSRLLNVWRARLSVMSLIPTLLQQLQTAEAALKGGWNALHLPSPVTPVAKDDWDLPTTTTLTRSDYEYMKSIVEQKVADPGRTLDRMLDSLEGFQDTLPDEWLDRMETIESGYGDWVVTCDTRIREAEWAQRVREQRAAKKVVEPEPEKEKNDAETSQPTVEISKEENDVEISQPTGELPEENDIETSQPTVELPIEDGTDAITVQVPLPQEEASTTPSAQGDLAREYSDAAGFDGTDNAALPDNQLPQTIPSPYEEEQPSTVREEEEDDVDLPPLPRKLDSQTSAFSQVFVDNSFEMEVGRLAASPTRPPAFEDELDDNFSLTSSPPVRKAKPRAPSVTFSDSPDIAPTPSFEVDEADTRPTTPLTESFMDDMDDSPTIHVQSPSKRRSGDDQLQQQISEILNGIPAKFTLSAEPSPVRLNTPDLNPPGLNLPQLKKSTKDATRRSQSSMSSRMSSRASTPSFMLTPAYNKNPRPRPKTSQDIKVYHLSRSTGEAPIKLFIRCVGENGERVMVRVGGGWADLGEYLKEYVNHHGRRSQAAGSDKIEIRDLPRVSTSRAATASPPSRPQSALDFSPITPLNVKKTRKSFGASTTDSGGNNSTGKAPAPKTPANPVTTAAPTENTPSSGASTRSRSSSRLSWGEDDSPMLGLAGPKSKPVEMSEESRAWVESVKEKVRLASGERKPSGSAADPTKFGEIGKAGSTKRLFRKN